MYEYNHGGNAVFETGRENVIDLSANINPLGMPEGVKDAIVRAVSDCGHYPDNFSEKLREKIAAFEGVNSEWIFCGNGTSDIIFRLPKTVQAKRMLIAIPTFLDYERAAVSYGAAVIHFPLSSHNGFALDHTFIEMVRREKPELVFLCSPNNPTGVLAETKFIAELLDYCLSIQSLVVIDECFMDFTGQADEYTGKVFLDRYKNLIILKAFTKLFALPGIRLGYAICADMEIIKNLYFHGADWPVTSLSQSAGIAALADAQDFIKRTAEYVSFHRDIIEKKLVILGYKVFGSRANYVFFQNQYPFDLQEELDRKGIRIRSCKNFPGLDDSYYRAAVSTAENNDRLLSAIDAINNSKEKPQ